MYNFPTMSTAKIRVYKLLKHKKISPLFLFLEGQNHMYPSVNFHFHAAYLLKQYL